MNRNNIHIKVCGLRDYNNIQQVANLNIDFLGLIFYPYSPRYVYHNENFTIKNINKTFVAVFVNQSLNYIIQQIELHNIKYVQLHGTESTEYCLTLRNNDITIIKTIHLPTYYNINDVNLIQELINQYSNYVDFFLFDTKINNIQNNYGGSGIKFNWEIINKLTISKPFFIAGGISLENINDIFKITHPNFFAIDVNSKFEVSPAIKNINNLITLINYLKK